ncbi:MAG TPA: ROK family protein, partial [Candidatus Brocadiia bacterium]|nr:ROK family protein [Candidatus Brocadiia bacterium]
MIRERGATSRLYISKQINIALPTVSTLVRDLIKRGIICENGYGESAGGRKPAHLRLNPSFAGAIGVEVSSRRITGAIADVSGAIRVADRRNSPGHYCRSEILQAIFTVIESLLSQAGGLPIKGIGLGVSGLIDGAGRVSRELPLAEGWKDVPLADIIEERFGQPVTLVNAVHAATLGEWRFSPRENSETNMLFLHMGRGIAAGLIIGGQLYLGATGNAGEFGHSVVRPDGPICHCGARGCLESVASPKAIVDQVREAISRGVRSSISSSAPESFTLDHVLQAAQTGDRLATNVVHEAGEFIGGALASLVNVLNPHVLVMGGVLAG